MATVTVILTDKEIQTWALMKSLEAMGAFDVRFGSVLINFDGQGKISNVKIEKNYRVQELST